MDCLDEKEYYYSKDYSKASKKETLSLLDQVTDDNGIIDKIKKEFPLNEGLNIAGAKEAINLFNEIDNKKYDFNLSLKCLNFSDVRRVAPRTNKYTLVFSVISEDGKKTLIQNVKTIYDGKKKLLDLLLEINVFADFMLKNDCKKELLTELTTLSKNKVVNNNTYNFRFIDSKDKKQTYLRSVVTQNRYKTYDNPIVLYISFIIIHNFSKAARTEFRLDSMQVTDSRLSASFLEQSKTEIEKGIFVTTGLNISNSELGDGAAKFNSIYKVENKDRKRVTVISDKLATIDHGNNPDTINEKLKKLEDLKKNREDTISAVKKIKWTKNITRDDVFVLMASIIHTKHVPLGLKRSMYASIKKIDLTQQAYNVLEIFDKLNGFLENEDPNINLILESKFSNWLTRF